MSKAADAFGHQNGHSRKRKTAGDLLDMLKESLGTHRSYKLAKFEKPNPYNQNSRTKKMELPKKNVQELIPGFAIHQSDELSEAEKEQLQRMPQLVAIDCEMVCSLGEPMALARCTVVALDGKCLLDEFVKPRTKIINFVSRYSGIYPRHMVNATPYYKAKEKIMQLLQNKVIVGHTLTSDFRSIGITVDQNYVVDVNKNYHIRKLLGIEKTNAAFGLKRMCKAFFDEDIQKKEHCSYEDAWSTMKVFKLALPQWIAEFKDVLTKNACSDTVHHAEPVVKHGKWLRSKIREPDSKKCLKLERKRVAEATKEKKEAMLRRLRRITMKEQIVSEKSKKLQTKRRSKVIKKQIEGLNLVSERSEKKEKEQIVSEKSKKLQTKRRSKVIKKQIEGLKLVSKRSEKKLSSEKKGPIRSEEKEINMKEGSSTLTEDEIDKLSDMWANAYTSTLDNFSRTEPVSEQQMFAELYNDIVLNSPAIHTILGVEHSYSIALREAQERKMREVADRTESCMLKLEQVKENAENNGTPLSDDQINRLYATHFEDLELLESTWESELSLLRDTQKNEFREWLNTVAEDIHSNDSSSLPYSSSSSKLSQICSSLEPYLEESFTIYLGTQLKTMHNIRLLVMDPIDLCRSNVEESKGSFSRDPHRMQTALTLYSNNLSALVMVVSNRVKDNCNFKSQLADVSSKNCEFHFAELDEQLQSIQEDVIELNSQRIGKSLQGSETSDSTTAIVSASSNELTVAPTNSLNSAESGSDQLSISSLSLNNSTGKTGAGGNLSAPNTTNVTPTHSLLSQLSPQNQRRLKALAPGDVYITRHSNLSRVHAILYLVGDAKVDNFEMTSQHAMFTGLRNIFRFAIDFDIINIYIPLLLTDQLSDDKTFDNCIKRAELVFKCVKGFMIEATTWTTTKSRTIQFLLPRKSSPQLFHQLRRNLQETFPISNPAVTTRKSSNLQL